MSSSTNYNRGRGRRGFTLTELLIGITIIGLLVGMLAVAGGGVLTRSQEFSVNAEIVQLSQSIENFKTKNGFYPPSFEQFKRTVNTGDTAVSTANRDIIRGEVLQLLPFLNKIAPNHRELSTPSPVTARASAGYTLLDDWWEHVGCNLDQTTSIPFWLSGLCQNKQFPLTGGMAAIMVAANGGPLASVTDYMPVGYNQLVFVDGDAIPGDLGRDVTYDFVVDRMIPVDILVPTGVSVSGITRPVVQYNSAYGKTNGDRFFVYRDNDSYLPVAQPHPLTFDDANDRTASPSPAGTVSDFASLAAYLVSPNHRGPAYYFVNDAGTPEFANPGTFQVISFGIDGDPGVSPTAITDGERGLLFNKVTGNQSIQLPSSADNLCNFAGGRLDKFIDDQQ